MNKKSSNLLLFSSLMLMIFVLVACSNDSSTDEETASGDGAGSESDLSADLQYWSSYNESEPQARVLLDAADAFMEENPGVSIEFTFNGRDNSELLPTAIQSGRDIHMYDANAVNIINRFSNSNMNLNEFFEESYPTTEDTPLKDYISQPMIDLARDLGEDELFYVPMNPQAFVFMYNKSIFDEAGVNEVPQTWEEFVAAGEKIIEAGYTPLTTDPNYSTGIFGYYLSSLKGEDWVFDLVEDETYEMWSDPAVLEAAKAIEELADKGFYADNVSTVQFPQAQQEFVIDENIAMYLNGTWMPGEVQDTVSEDFEWGQFQFPTVEGGVNDNTHTAYSSYGIGVNQDNTNEEAEAAFNFAVFVNTGEWDQQMVDQAKALPIDTNNENPEALTDMAEIFENTEGNYVSQTAIATNSDNSQIIRSAFINLISGESTAEEFIAEIQDSN
ncbi:ABC transporter substrate-binding protein [Jeotgalicoccus huakuii]|uniref:ABC transporter substrate-binding protein n=1 Tax=Jeotgalicoccus TaxID=227979 RepID=UPI0003F58BC8|nr:MULTISPECIES: ABC transporter substrate-binding protein [Jeotgalicoccus]MCK1976812.1 ABC transporter substrate-binding protein [Jeotgalicoccus huakuii]QQD84468.1 carbohydrate ABC transporter substrate-binding protein [Jeotgalicoccus sp. ATCC 8456]